MKRLFFLLFFGFPFYVFSNNEVPPEGYKLVWILVILIALPLLYYLGRTFFFSKKNKKGVPGSLPRRKLKIELIKDRQYRPRSLTLKVSNNSKSDIDIQSPVLIFRKIWSIRKFRLKGINRYEIYPLYLEAGKVHELPIVLSVFYQHDKKLSRFYWAKILVTDTKGKKYYSSRITLRKSLFS